MLSVLSSPKNLKLQYSTLWPYLPTFSVFALPYSIHFAWFLASQNVPVSWLPHFFFNKQCFFFPANPTPSDRLSELFCLLTLITLHLSVSSHVAQENPNLESMFQSPFSIPIPTHQLHTADKNQDVLRVVSITYSWLQNLFEPLAPCIKPLTCSWSAPFYILHSNYSKCLPFCLYPLSFFLSVDDLSSYFINETEIIKWNLPNLCACLCINLFTSISVWIPSLQPQKMWYHSSH